MASKCFHLYSKANLVIWNCLYTQCVIKSTFFLIFLDNLTILPLNKNSNSRWRLKIRNRFPMMCSTNQFYLFSSMVRVFLLAKTLISGQWETPLRWELVLKRKACFRYADSYTLRKKVALLAYLNHCSTGLAKQYLVLHKTHTLWKYIRNNSFPSKFILAGPNLSNSKFCESFSL